MNSEDNLPPLQIIDVGPASRGVWIEKSTMTMDHVADDAGVPQLEMTEHMLPKGNKTASK